MVLNECRSVLFWILGQRALPFLTSYLELELEFEQLGPITPFMTDAFEICILPKYYLRQN